MLKHKMEQSVRVVSWAACHPPRTCISFSVFMGLKDWKWKGGGRKTKQQGKTIQPQNITFTRYGTTRTRNVLRTKTSQHEQTNSISLSSPDDCWIFPHEREKVFGTTRKNCNRDKKILADNNNNNHLHMNKRILSAKFLPLFTRSFPNFSPLCLMILSSLPTRISPSCKPSSSVAYNLCYLLPLLKISLKRILINISLSLSLSPTSTHSATSRTKVFLLTQHHTESLPPTIWWAGNRISQATELEFHTPCFVLCTFCCFRGMFLFVFVCYM